MILASCYEVSVKRQQQQQQQRQQYAISRCESLIRSASMDMLLASYGATIVKRRSRAINSNRPLKQKVEAREGAIRNGPLLVQKLQRCVSCSARTER